MCLTSYEPVPPLYYGSQYIAARLVDSVAHTQFPGQKKNAIERITLSVGCASFPRDAKSSNDLVIKADKALYTAKQKGRNQFCWASHQEKKERVFQKA